MSDAKCGKSYDSRSLSGTNHETNPFSHPQEPLYLATVFELQREHKVPEFAVVTAYNPDGNEVSEKENAIADEALREAIRCGGWEPFRVVGKSPDGQHAEPGWGIACDLDRAIQFGLAFRQVAVFYFSGEEIWLAYCYTGYSKPLPFQPDRVRYC